MVTRVCGADVLVLGKSSSDVLSPISKQDQKHNYLFIKLWLLKLFSHVKITLGTLRFRVNIDTSIDAMTDFPILFDS